MSESFFPQTESAENVNPDGPDFPDSDRCLRAMRDPEARFILFRGERVLLEKGRPIRPVWVSPLDLSGLGTDTRTAVDLGTGSAGPRMAIDLEDIPEECAKIRALRGEFRSLRDIQEPIAPHTWRTLSRARALLAWNLRNVVCPTCGAATAPQAGGRLRICTNAACARPHFPRTDPSVIVRIVSGNKVLLARQPSFRTGLRSVLAGFVEPGETLEEAARREVGEEVGIAVDQVEYLGSQPWPFPMTLMIAFEAHAREETIRLDQDELEAADWYTRERIRLELAEGSLALPSQKSIARWMIDDWLEEDGGTPRTTRERLTDPV